jgi:hypothetical protein
LVKQYLTHEKYNQIVVIDIDYSAECKVLEEKGVVFFKEDARLPNVLRQVGVARAHCVYILTGADQTNLAIHKAFDQIINTVGNSERKVNSTCIFNLYDAKLKSLIDNKLSKKGHSDWNVRINNTWENSARVLLAGEHGPHLHCLDEQQPHLLILGHSRLAEQLIILGAKLGHYSNGRKLRITYVDKDAEHMRNMLYAHYPVLDPDRVDHLAWHENESKFLPVIDTCFVAIPANSLTGKIYAEITRDVPVSVAYICDSDNEQVMSILSSLEANLSVGVSINRPHIVICNVRGDDAIMDYTIHDNQLGKVAYFDAVKEGLRLESGESVVGNLREDWAKSIHDFYQNKHGGIAWEALPEYLRNSNRLSADHWKIKLDWIRHNTEEDILLSLKENKEIRDQLMRMEHDRWSAERFMGGWRYCDKPVSKDEQNVAKLKKQNWCLCCFDDLSTEDQQKDGDVCDIAAKLYQFKK